MHKLAIIVPYRDRADHLIIFKKSIINYLNNKNIDFELIIVEQDDAKTFNRGKLLNIGFKYAQRLKCDYIVFHDIDMIPIDADYSYSPHPIHLSSKFISSNTNFNRIVFDEYFGGVTLFPTILFDAINGYSNEYWGWGYEDNDLLERCKLFNIELNTKEIKMPGVNMASLQFNGNDSYVVGKNIIDTKNQITIFLSFMPEELTCNPETYDDTFSAFTIPGLDMSINYNSYGRYNFEIYDASENIIYINSEIKPNYKTNICVTIDPKNEIVTMYQDGIIVGSKKIENRLHLYKKEPHFYLGVGDPNREDNPKFFKGLIQSFAIFDGILKEEEIIEISTNDFFGLSQSYGDYQSPHLLKTYYDAKFMKEYKLIDLSGNNNDGVVINCGMTGISTEKNKIIYIPHRREGAFKLISHEENGFVNGSWKNITTRYNQMRYINEVSKGYKNPKQDGLNSLQYTEIDKTKISNQTHLLVSI